MKYIVRHKFFNFLYKKEPIIKKMYGSKTNPLTLFQKYAYPFSKNVQGPKSIDNLLCPYFADSKIHT